MKRSTIAGKLWPVVFWLAVWQIASMLIGQEILLVSPVSVVRRLLLLLPEIAFWHTVLFSLLRILAGFFSAALLGALLAALAARFVRMRELLSPLILVIKSTPVASFIILALFLLPSENLSAYMAFLMVLPILYGNVLEGISGTDPKLLEMARLFRVPGWKRLRYIYVPGVLPFFRAACKVSIGLSWKAGIAAEVIGIPRGSIGERLYQSKIYLNMADLFAWTLVIILVSLLFEKLFLLLLDRGMRRLEGM